MRHILIILSIFLFSLTLISCSSSSSSDDGSATTSTTPDNDSTSDDDTTTTTTSSGLFVGVGGSGTIVTSSDGSTLDTRTSGTTQSLTGVTYGNGLYVAVGGGGTILTSSDGITWSIRTPGTVNCCNGVAYGNGTFVGVGAYGVILSSTDGITWTDRSVTYDGNSSLLNIPYGNGLFVAVGYRGVQYISSDGITWTSINTRDNGIGNMIYGVTYGNGLYVAVGMYQPIIASDNGSNWTFKKTASLDTVWFNGVYYSNGLFLTVGSYGIIYSSSDGNTWTQKTSGATETLYNIAYGNSTYVIVGENIILTSSDGTTWTSHTATGMTLNDVIYKEPTSDTTAPVISKVTAVTTPTNDSTPNYTFSSTEAGTITYGGSCSSSTTSAISGNNTITLVSLSEGTYSDCTVKVTDAAKYVSNTLTITSFTVDLSAATLVEVTAVTTPTNDTTPNYTFSSSEAGTITYGGSCSSVTTSATTDNNTITLVSLSEDTYSDCTITVTDTASNSVTLNISSFIIDTTAPTVASIYPTDNQSGISITTDNISVTFSEAMDNTSVTTNTDNTTCSGSFQLSSDSFSGCVQMSSSPSSSNSDRTFTIDPSNSLSYSTTYKIRVTTGVKDSAGNTLSSQYETSIGFSTWSGTQQLGTSSNDKGYGVTADSSDNIYVTGDTAGGLDNNTNSGSNDIFLVKYNSSGTKQWTKQLGTSSTETGYGVTVDSSNNLYVTGYTNGGLDNNTNSGSNDIFLVKYNSSGTKQWTKQLGTSGIDIGNGVTVDSSDNIYVTGYTNGGLDNNTNSGSNDIFLVKYNSSGTKQWTKQLGTSSGDIGYGVTVDSSDNIYVTGNTWGGLDNNTNSGSTDLFLVKYNSSGTKQWTQQLGSSSEEKGRGVAVDSSDNIYVTGLTGGGLDSNSHSGSLDIFLVKYNSSGTKQWTRQLGFSSDDRGYGVAVDSSDNIYVTGITFLNPVYNFILVKYNSSGTKQWTKILYTSETDRGYGVTVDSSNNIYVTGETEGGLDGNTNSGGYDIFLVRYNSDGVLQ